MATVFPQGGGYPGYSAIHEKCKHAKISGKEF